MHRRHRPTRSRLAGVILCAALSGVLLGALPACGNAEPEAPSPFAAEPEYTYTVRGTVVTLPGPTSDLSVHHEPIPDFVDPRTGEVFVNPDDTLGMKAMVMPMPPRPGLDISTLNVGDEVMITFGVWTGLDTPAGFAHRMTGYERIEGGAQGERAPEPDAEPADGP
ncbi:MAG: hypothetical protein AAF356_11830 [Planctomycetota bacterium]